MNLQDLENLTKDQWEEIAFDAIKKIDTRLFIDGDYVEAKKKGKFETVNPDTGEVITMVSKGDGEDIDEAVRSGRRSFNSGTWSGMAPRERMEIMYKWSEMIQENAGELAALESLDMGKPISDCISFDIPSVSKFIQFCGECIDKIVGRVTSNAPGIIHLVTREPYGVIGAISPWNFPLYMATWKVAPALAAGNSVVLKPAEQSPLSCLRLAQLFIEAGGPAGIFNVVNGPGEVTGKALAMHNDVDKIRFTGSAEVGKLMFVYSGQSNMKEVSVECGGKSPNIFLSDLPDMEEAVEAACDGIFSLSGQVCTAGSRLLVDRKFYGDFIDAFTAKANDTYKPGRPLDPATTMGPMVTHQAQKNVLEDIETGKNEGAVLKFGGGTPEELPEGAYVNPTLFIDVSNDMTIARKEIFGPVASIIPVDGIDEVVRVSNDTIYGLGAGVWTSNLSTAHRLIREIKAGMVWVNTYDSGDMTQPFGGFKQSGNAKDNCMESVIDCMHEKSAWIQA
jgi:acyl-CoA reductase-like NAD-dependent aldehyde dehydrogenase